MLRRLLLGVFRKLASLVGVPEIQHRLDLLESEIETAKQRQSAFERLIDTRTEERILDRVRDPSLLLEGLGSHLDEIQKALTESMVKHTEMVDKNTRHDLMIEVAKIRRYVDNLQVAQSSSSSSSSPDVQFSGEHQVPTISDALYVSLEDYFRGDQAVIRERQSQYLTFIRDAPVDQGHVLDLGCGRGEWLQLLNDEGINAQGVDSNAACVRECVESGLVVHHCDLLEYLRSVPDRSCSAITMFQVLEHLPFPLLIDVLRQSLRSLLPGGVFIGEVPNSENLTVAASTFWIDPTHQRPLFPELLKFLAKQAGFTHIDGHFSTPLKPIPELASTNHSLESFLIDVHTSLYGSADFALIARV